MRLGMAGWLTAGAVPKFPASSNSRHAVSVDLQQQLQLALGDSYQLERELGGGGMSRVFVAHERALGRKVVVKVLLPELAAGVNVERFRREIQLAAQLQHPHIVPLLSAGEAEGLPYFIMPYVTGESLRTRLTREGEFPIPETVRTLRDVVSALAYAHAHGVVHRDIKPDNVLLSHGVAVVTDFGVAKAVSASSGSSAGSLTSHGMALGTPAYMAPEQATGSPHTDHRADIYSLGVMAYEMLTGSPPFAGRSAQAVLAAQVVEDPEPVERRRPAVPPLLATLVKECLCKRPADRPQSASQVMNVLDAIVTPSGGTAATTAVKLQPPRPGTSPGRRKTAAGALVVMALLLGGTLWVRRNQSPTVSVSADTSVTTPREHVTAAVRPVPTPSQPPVAAPPPSTKPLKSERRPVARASVPRPAQSSVPSLPRKDRPPADSAPGDSAPGTLAPGVPRMNPLAITAESAPSPVMKTRRPAPPAAATVAPDSTPADPRPIIRNVVSRYAAAIQSRSVSDLKRVYPGMTSIQQRGWEQFFQLVRNVKAELSITQLDLSSRTAETQVAGTYTYLNTSTGRMEHQPVAFHAAFRLDGGHWRMIQVR